MKKRFTEEQIIKILKEHENGKRAADLVREYNITEQTFYRWKGKYGGIEISKVKRLKQLEEENCWLKELVADLTLDYKWPHSALENLTLDEYAFKISR